MRDRARARLSSNLELWRATHRRDDDASQMVREHVLSDLLRLAWREKLQISPVLRPSDAAMETAKTWLENHAIQTISLAKLAEKNRLSPVAFTRRFRAATGQTPSDFLLHCRLEHARKLLLDTDWTLDLVASQSGFGNGFYLSRVWSKKWGNTPSNFRRTHRV